jgi:spore germination cell wall hydrolase CwlJ-like protein
MTGRKVIALLAKKTTGYVLLAWLGSSLLLPLGLRSHPEPKPNQLKSKTTQTISPRKEYQPSDAAKNRLVSRTQKSPTPLPPKADPALPTQIKKEPTQTINRQPVEQVKYTPITETTTNRRQTAVISGYQFQMLARIISAEAKGEPFHGQVAVGAVILNRVKSGRFPNNIAANVLKRGQFEPVANGAIWREPTPSAYRAARLALNGWDPTGGALYFFNPAKSTSRWIWSRPVVTRIGDHLFAV